MLQMRFLLSAIFILISLLLFSQEKIDTISFCKGCNYVIRTFDSYNVLRFSCQFAPDSISLERETIFNHDGKCIREIYFGPESERAITEWNVATGRMEFSSYNSFGELKWWNEVPTDSTDAKTISYYTSGQKMEEGYLAIVDVYEADYNDSLLLKRLKFQHQKSQTNVGFWKYYYPNGQISDEGNYARFCVLAIDTLPSEYQGEIILIGIISQLTNIKTGTWNYYSPEGKLIRREEWDEGNLMKRETF